MLYGAEVYQRGGLMVRPVLTRFEASNKREAMGWHLIPVTRPWLVNTLTCAARFWRYNGRSKAWVPIDAPDKVADTYLARRGGWKLAGAGRNHPPPVPARRRLDLRATPDYDSASGLLFKPEGERYPPVPLQPSKSDARRGARQARRADPGIPVRAGQGSLGRAVGDSDHARPPLDADRAAACLHRRPTAGTGKSLLVDTCAVLATGRPMPVISQGQHRGRTGEALGAALLAGDMAFRWITAIAKSADRFCARCSHNGM